MVKRELYLRKIRPFVGTDVVKVITGMRRSGKSVLLEQIQEELKSSNPRARIFAVNLDDDENKHFLEKGVLYTHLNNILKEAGDEMVHLFLDDTRCRGMGNRSQFPADAKERRHLHYGIELEASFWRACNISYRTICGDLHDAVFVRRVHRGGRAIIPR